MHTDRHVVFELVSGYVGDVAQILVFAQLNREAFGAVHGQHRQRTRVLQEHLTTLVRLQLRNQYDYKQLNEDKKRLEAEVAPVTLRCRHRNTKGSKQHQLCGRGFVTFPGSGVTRCDRHGGRRILVCGSTRRAADLLSLRTIGAELEALDETWEDLDARMHKIRDVRQRLSATCFGG